MNKSFLLFADGAITQEKESDLEIFLLMLEQIGKEERWNEYPPDSNPFSHEFLLLKIKHDSLSK